MTKLKSVAGTAARATAPVELLAQGAIETKDTQGQAPEMPDREQRIREVAYGCFVERGCVEGHALDDWLKAESQVEQSMRDEARGAVAATVEH